MNDSHPSCSLCKHAAKGSSSILHGDNQNEYHMRMTTALRYLLWNNIFWVFFKCDFFLFCTGTTDYELLACLTTLQFPQCRALPLLFDYSRMFSTEIMTVTSGNDFQRASIIQLARLDNHSQFRLCENSDKQHFGCEMTQIQRNLSFLLSLSLSTALASELL